MYTTKTSLILGFHGCDESLRDKVVADKKELKPSNNSYDWLGSGMYFWENNLQRAQEFAEFLKDHPHNPRQRIEKPAVLGAVIDLGYCLDLLDSENLKLLKVGYKMLKEAYKVTGFDMPENKPLKENEDLLLRYLDRAVIEQIHDFNLHEEKPEYDSVRGVFWEGDEIYSNAGFKEKNHIQIAIRNPNCIKGYFIPRKVNKKYGKV
jgi:hypothetical protein